MDCQSVIFNEKEIPRSVVFSLILFFTITLLPVLLLLGAIPSGSSRSDYVKIIIGSVMFGALAFIFFGSFLYPIEKYCNRGWLYAYIAALIIVTFVVELLAAFIIGVINGVVLFTSFTNINNALDLTIYSNTNITN